ncbi:molybdopterin synthase [Halorarius litoreus]|uniref:molybdopterin synthase n=1 Tax=Halorarius litoreus TaxID=2962676 RepID=UPI0020CD57C0|nr:molybdopterin synthase [Halorarius litoreus]
MHTFGIVGTDAAAACDRFVEALGGRVAVVRNRKLEEADGGRQRARPATEYDLGAEWRAYGDGLSLREAFDRLAPDHDYAVAIGFPQARIPQVVVGDVAGELADEEPLATASDAASLDVTAVVAAVDDTDPHVTLESLVTRVKRSPKADRAGAIATFTGRVRAKDSADDERTELLEFETYEGVAERRMRAIEDELEAREGVFEVAMHHRTGVIPDGEDIVFVVVLAGHREEAFRTVEDGINRLKDEVPIFKKEVTESETFWVHER